MKKAQAAFINDGKPPVVKGASCPNCGSKMAKGSMCKCGGMGKGMAKGMTKGDGHKMDKKLVMFNTNKGMMTKGDMCKCGSGMSKASCNCGMGKSMHKGADWCKKCNMAKAACNCASKSMRKGGGGGDYVPDTTPTPKSGGSYKIGNAPAKNVLGAMSSPAKRGGGTAYKMTKGVMPKPKPGSGGQYGGINPGGKKPGKTPGSDVPVTKPPPYKHQDKMGKVAGSMKKPTKDQVAYFDPMLADELFSGKASKKK